VRRNDSTLVLPIIRSAMETFSSPSIADASNENSGRSCSASKKPLMLYSCGSLSIFSTFSLLANMSGLSGLSGFVPAHARTRESQTGRGDKQRLGVRTGRGCVCIIDAAVNALPACCLCGQGGGRGRRTFDLVVCCAQLTSGCAPLR